MLEVFDLHIYYEDSHVLRGVTVALPAGQALGLLGRNGMGKTTLIRSLMGCLRPTAGRVYWTTLDGRRLDVTGWPPERMSRLGIAYVPEGRGIFPNLSVRENLVMAARTGVDGRRDWTLDRVLDTFARLRERFAADGYRLSGGEQQMLSIGRALLTNPRLLILDEATEGLAPRIATDIWQVIARIRDAGISTLVVDRNYRRVLAHTNRAIVLEKGRVVLAGESAALGADHHALARFLGI